MRIVGGSLGGRRFQPPAKMPARPTTDMARQGLFNILGNFLDLEDVHVLDLFSGTGAVAYECASRGAARIDCVERDASCADFIRTTAATFGIKGLRIHRGDVFSFFSRLQQHSYGFVFADPPYAHPRLAQLPDLIFAHALAPEGVAVVEHDDRTDFTKHPHFFREARYGDSRFSFFTAHPTL